MPLPILNTPTGPHDKDLIRFYHRTERLWAEHLATSVELSGGTAFSNERLAGISEANQMLDASLQDDQTALSIVSEVERHFAAAGSRCAAWTLNPSSAIERTQPLVDHLLSIGYRPSTAAIMHLSQAQSLQVNSIADLRFIPARAGFRQIRLLADESAEEQNLPASADAEMLHLDDPHWDAILALDGTTPIGMAGVLIAGEVGRVDNVYVSERRRGEGIGLQLLSRVLQTCARSLIRHVMLSVVDENRTAAALCQKFGFRRVGTLTSYRPARMPTTGSDV